MYKSKNGYLAKEDGQNYIDFARDIKVAKYLLRKKFPFQQVLDATNLNPKELSIVIKEVRKEANYQYE